MSTRMIRAAMLTSALIAVSGCQPGEFPFGAAQSSDDTAAVGENVAMIERDTEAPEIFQKTDQAVWDGRPSLGGVWVAADGVREPERVIIRNTSNDKFVIGALFKRERSGPGPALQLSSDAANALGIVAGQPAEINVTALRKELVPDPNAAPPEPAVVEDAPLDSGEAAPAATVTATTLDDPGDVAATAEAAIAAAEQNVAAAPPSRLDKPFVQIGIFSIESNARNTATALRQAGLLPTVLEQSSSGRKFWRVIVGPAPTAADRAQVLRTAKGLGFTDAYAVTN